MHTGLRRLCDARRDGRAHLLASCHDSRQREHTCASNSRGPRDHFHVTHGKAIPHRFHQTLIQLTLHSPGLHILRRPLGPQQLHALRSHDLKHHRRHHQYRSYVLALRLRLAQRTAIHRLVQLHRLVRHPSARLDIRDAATMCSFPSKSERWPLSPGTF